MPQQLTQRDIEPRRLFVRVRDPKTFLTELGEDGAFVPTRLSFELHEHVLLTLRLGDRGRTIEIPVVIAGRRVSRPTDKTLSAGVKVQVADPTRPTAALVAALARGEVVDFEERLREVASIDVLVHFDTIDELLREVGFLTHGGVATVPVETPLHPGDRALVRLSAAGGPALPAVRAEVRGVILRENQDWARVELMNEADRARLLAPLVRPKRSRLIVHRQR